MGKHREPSAEELEKWESSVSNCPQHVRSVIDRFKPWILYQLGSSGMKVVIIQFTEDANLKVTVQAGVLAEFNADLLREGRVINIELDHLVECDVPSDAERAINRATHEWMKMRPDLWRLRRDGAVIHKFSA